MKVIFITTSGSPFDGKYLEKELPCAPNLGDFIEFTDEEAVCLDRNVDVGGALLVVIERCFLANGALCVTVDTDEVRKNIGYKNHLTKGE